MEPYMITRIFCLFGGGAEEREDESVNGGILIWIMPRLNGVTAVVASASAPDAGLSLVKNLMEVCILIAFCLCILVVTDWCLYSIIIIISSSIFWYILIETYA